MSFALVSGVEIGGIVCCLPKQIDSNLTNGLLAADEIEKVTSSIGIKEKRVASPEICASDLCVQAAKKLIQNLQLKSEDIELVIFVSQTPDHKIPATACLIQRRLELSSECIAFDINLGCSGFVYGLSVVSSMLSSMGLKGALLLVGDTLTQYVDQADRTVSLLFGDAGSACYLRHSSHDQLFHLQSDGSEAITIRGGGSRDRGSEKERLPPMLKMQGVEVFNFTLREVVKNIVQLCERFSVDKEQIDFYVFHQANKMILDLLQKRLGVPAEKSIRALELFGNTSGATIPLALCHRFGSPLTSPLNVLMSGFGVGLSWGSVYTRLPKGLVTGIVEYESL